MGKAGIRGARCLEGECYDNGSPVPSFTAHPSFEKLWMTTLVNDGASPQEALDRPRFFIEPELDGGRIYLEGAMPSEVGSGLSARGHEVVFDPPTYGRSMFGRGQVIVRQADGTLVGGSDPRADGCALEA